MTPATFVSKLVHLVIQCRVFFLFYISLYNQPASSTYYAWNAHVLNKIVQLLALSCDICLANYSNILYTYIYI